MTISAENVKKLRDITQAGMLDCKKALMETNGDFEAAIDFLRKKGKALAATKSGRSTSEGAIALCVEDNKGAIVELNSETDFVARNKDFQEVALNVAKIACESQLDYEKLLATRYLDESQDVKDKVFELVGKIKENISLGKSEVVSVEEGIIASYVHNAYAENLGKIGVLVALDSKISAKDKLKEVGKKVAMHVAAAKPRVLKAEDLTQDDLNREKEIYKEQARSSGKPENIIDKMVEGRIKKFYEEVVLLEQPFIFDTKMKVKEFIESSSKELGDKIEMKNFKLFIVGD